MTLDLHATPREVMRAVEALEAFGQARQIGEKTLFGLKLALEECGSNVVNHALRRDEQQTFHISMEHVGDTIIIELRDRGPEFDPTRASSMSAELGDEDRPPGGWGIQLARHYTDEVRYTREAGENVLQLIKRLPPMAKRIEG